MPPAVERDPDHRMGVGGFSVPVWISGGRGKVRRIILTSHGLTNDHRDAPLFARLRDEFGNLEGTALVEFDYPGSGTADGELADKRLSLLRRALVAVADLARRETGGSVPLAIIGRSMGATVALATTDDVKPAATAVMSPPFHLTTSIGRLKGQPDGDGNFPLPPSAAPSGQVKGKIALSSAFYAELPAEEQLLREAVRRATNVLLIASVADPKVSREEQDDLWSLLEDQPGNTRRVFASDHNYTAVEDQVMELLVGWGTSIGSPSHG